MLVFVDRGLVSYDLIQDVGQQGAHLVARVESRLKLTPIQYLSDGSYLAKFSPRDYPRRKQEHIIVRVVKYTLNDEIRSSSQAVHRILTTLLDENLACSRQLVCAYHEHWEVEITIDELDTHQRVPYVPESLMV